jgi:hypothetical protein
MSVYNNLHVKKLKRPRQRPGAAKCKRCGWLITYDNLVFDPFSLSPDPKAFMCKACIGDLGLTWPW